MSELFLLLLIPLLVPWITRIIFKTTITWMEMLLQIFISSIVVCIVWFSGIYYQTIATEIINGHITKKEKKKVSCTHSYDCNCKNVKSCSGSGKNRTCTTERKCDTCYEHPYDFDWLVHTSLFNKESIEINREDKQGIKEPKRWSKIKIGEPAASEHDYKNYVKAVKDSLFNKGTDLEQYKNMIPKYPRVYDYYKVMHIFTVGMGLSDLKLWNDDLSNILSRLGPKKQANIILMIIKSPDRKFRHAVEYEWKKGNKNDIIIFIGYDGEKIIWTEIMSWSKDSLFDVKLRDSILEIGNLDREKIISTINTTTDKYYFRKPMKDFEYLKYEIKPPFWVIVTAFLLGLILSIVTTIIAHKYDIFED